MAGLNNQVRGELDHSQGLRVAQNQKEKPDLDQESDAHDRD
jgi:hypothetical protein